MIFLLLLKELRALQRHTLDVKLDDILTFCDTFGPYIENGRQKHLHGQQVIQDVHPLQNILVFEGDAHSHQVQHTADEFLAPGGMLELPVHPIPSMDFDQLGDVFHTDPNDPFQCSGTFVEIGISPGRLLGFLGCFLSVSLRRGDATLSSSSSIPKTIVRVFMV
jgi:hypothetical protein